jgi:hypothetical protein
MPETPPNLWQRFRKGPTSSLAWFGLLFVACFITICVLQLCAGQGESASEVLLVALLFSLVVAGILGPCIRWLSCWRNFRRFLFGLACLLTLIALAYTEENWRGKRAWQSHRRECEAKGEHLELAAFLPPPVSDDKNFALTPLLKPVLDFSYDATGVVRHDTNGVAHLESISAALPPGRETNDHLVLGSVEKATFADLAGCAAFYRGNTNYPQLGPAAKPQETILAALAKFTPEITELQAARVGRPSCRFPVHYDYEPEWGILLPHLARMKGLTVLMHVRATAELEAGRPAEAFDDLKLGFRLSDCIRDEPLLIDHLVWIATIGLNLQTIREGLARHSWSESQLAEMQNWLAGVDALAEYKHAMRGERALNTAGLDFLRRQGFRGSPMQYFGNEEGASAVSPGFSPFPSGWFYQNMLTISRMYQDYTLPAVDEHAHRVFPEVSAKGEHAVVQLRVGPYTIFAKMLLPAYERAVRGSARMQSFVDSARVACALERFRLANGTLPESLDVLPPHFIDRLPSDVIDGKPIRFRRQPDGRYLLYSVGWNQKDDGGEMAWKQPKKEAIDITKGDWVWELPAR